jgi:uncharacterized LabA/DUF88 family protein
MDRIAVFVDAGYVFSGGSALLTGKNLKRGELQLNADRFLALVKAKAHELSGLPLLRVYWYDGTAFGPTPFQLEMAHRDGVKIRLGIVNDFGQQKGVDSLIVTDLINLARNRGMAEALLVTGDEDIRVGVQQAQEFGVRVHLVGLEQCAGSGVSALLRQESDTFTTVSREEVASFLTAAPRPGPEAAAAAAVPTSLSHGETSLTVAPEARQISTTIPSSSTTAGDPIAAAARKLAGELRTSDIALAARATGLIPAHIDRQLLAVGVKQLGETLDPETKRLLREALKRVCNEKVASGS